MTEAIIITGLINGGIYALLAVGFSLIIGVAKIINLAHTAFYMIAAYIIYFLAIMLGLNFALSAVIAIVCATALAFISYKLFVERVREHETTVLLVTVSLATVFQEIVLILFSGMYRGSPQLFPGFYELFGVRISYQDLFTLLLIVIIILLIWFYLYGTKQGLAIRVTAQDREVANLMGINVPRICVIVIVVASALSAISGVTIAPKYVLGPHMWTAPMLTAIAVVILGGLGSIKGSFIGAFMLAYAEVLVTYFVPGGSFLKGAVAMIVMLAVLLIRPEGLFGIAFEEERL